MACHSNFNLIFVKIAYHKSFNFSFVDDQIDYHSIFRFAVIKIDSFNFQIYRRSPDLAGSLSDESVTIDKLREEVCSAVEAEIRNQITESVQSYSSNIDPQVFYLHFPNRDLLSLPLK